MSIVTQIHTGAIVDDDLPLVPPGEYALQYVQHRTWMMFRRCPKLIIEFAITDDDMYSGVLLNKYYNVKKLKGKQGENGNFVVGRKSNFLREFYSVCPAYPPKRLDRIPMSRLEGIDIHGKVKTVTKGHDQKEIPEALQYSVIAEIYR